MRYLFLFIMFFIPSIVCATVCSVAPPDCSINSQIGDTCRTYHALERSVYFDVKLASWASNHVCSDTIGYSCFSDTEILPSTWNDGGQVYLFKSCNGSSECSGVFSHEGTTVSFYTTAPVCPTPPPPDPEHCNDKSASGDEEGVDCGGSCAAECVQDCNDGDELGYSDKYGEDRCFKPPVQRDNYGNCPKDYYGGTGDAYNFCFYSYMPTLVSQVVLDNNETPVVLTPAPWSAGSSVTRENYVTQTETVYNTETIDNGDGTTTTKTVRSETTQGIENSPDYKTVKIVEHYVTRDAQGNIIAESEKVSEQPTEAPITDYNLRQPDPLSDEGWGLGDFGTGASKYDSTVEPPESKSITDKLGEFASSHPVAQILQTVTVSEVNGQCSMSVEETWHGQPVVIDFDLCPWENTLRTLGAVFLIICQAYGIMIVMGRDRKGES